LITCSRVSFSIDLSSVDVSKRRSTICHTELPCIQQTVLTHQNRTRWYQKTIKLTFIRLTFLNLLLISMCSSYLALLSGSAARSGCRTLSCISYPLAKFFCSSFSSRFLLAKRATPDDNAHSQSIIMTIIAAETAPKMKKPSQIRYSALEVFGGCRGLG